MYKLVTLTTVMLLLLLPGGHGEGQEVKVDQAQCEAACDMGIYYDGCKCFRQVLFLKVCFEVFETGTILQLLLYVFWLTFTLLFWIPILVIPKKLKYHAQNH